MLEFPTICIATLILVSPWKNIFIIPKSYALVFLISLMCGRVILNKSNINFFSKIGNVFLIGSVSGFLVLASKSLYSGLYIVAAGYFLDFLVILVNGGRMPVEVPMVLKTGREFPFPNGTVIHQPADNSTRLRFLDDRFHAPLFHGKTIVSVGDCFITIGIWITGIQLFF